MIKKTKMWVVQCDKCKKYYSSDNNIFDCFENKSEAIEVITSDDFAWQVKGEKVYCEDCRTY